MPHNPSYKIGLAGYGKMGAAMVDAWLNSGLIQTIDILDPNAVPDHILSHKNVTAFKTETDFAANAATWDMLVLAIKPQTLENFGITISPRLPASLPVLSIAAGKTLSALAKNLGARPLIRSMPNTPAAIGKGMTVAVANSQTNASHKITAKNLLSALGLFEWVDDESLLDAVTGLSGSGPAYVFYLIEAMEKAGTDAGLSAAMAAKLARQTVIGAAALAEHETQTPASKLRENVTSPNGTTAAALDILMDGKFQDIVTKAIARATARSKELSS